MPRIELDTSPMFAADALGIRPQFIYSLIRRGKITSDKGRQINMDELKAYIATMRRPDIDPKYAEMRRAEKEELPVKVGDILSWNPRISNGMYHGIKRAPVRRFARVVWWIAFSRNSKYQESRRTLGQLRH